MPKISVLTPSIRPQYLNITQECLERQTFTDFEWLVEVGLRKQGRWGLPTDDNKMLRRAKGERIIILQDCIRIDDDALERIALLPLDIFYTFPVGKVQEFGDAPSWDWREHKSWQIDPPHWESDFGSAPLKAFKDIGGYDEDFCNGWAWDNVELAWRAQAAGYTFFCDNTIRGVALDHDALTPNPFRNKLENNDKRAEATWKRAQHGDYKLDYL